MIGWIPTEHPAPDGMAMVRSGSLQGISSGTILPSTDQGHGVVRVSDPEWLLQVRDKEVERWCIAGEQRSASESQLLESNGPVQCRGRATEWLVVIPVGTCPQTTLHKRNREYQGTGGGWQRPAQHT